MRRERARKSHRPHPEERSDAWAPPKREQAYASRSIENRAREPGFPRAGRFARRSRGSLRCSLPAMTDQDDEQDFAELINQAAADGWVKAMGIRLVRATKTEIAGELVIG